MQNPEKCAIITVAHLLLWGDIVKKAKKYIYPFIFSISFFALFVIVVIVINRFYGNKEGYGGLGLALLFILLWILVATPIFCFKYSKHIYEEKRKFLFIIYNSLVISLCHTGPFLISAIPGNDADIIIKITLALFGWIAICTYVSYLVRINTTKEPNENNSNETRDSVKKG